MTHTLTHDTIEQDHYVDRYVMNKLDEEKRDLFEAHFIECEQCLENLEWAQAHIRDLQTVAEQGWPAEAPSLWARLKAWLTLPQMALVAAVLVLALSISWFQGSRGEEVVWNLQTTRSAQVNVFKLEAGKRPVINIDITGGTAQTYRMRMYSGDELVLEASGDVANGKIRQELRHTHPGGYIVSLELVG